MATKKASEAAEVLRKLKQRLESDDEDFSDDERQALDFVVQELRSLEGFTDDRSHDA
jgi:hypothetical protein